MTNLNEKYSNKKFLNLNEAPVIHNIFIKTMVHRVHSEKGMN